MGGRFVGNEYRNTTLCVDSYEQGVPVGRFYNPACPGGTAFRSLSQLLIRLQELLDGMRFPQASTLTRSFSGERMELERDKGPPGSEERGALGTFTVRVLFRQNSSWQGSVTWLEGRREESFRSALELVFLLDSAMGPCNEARPPGA